VLPSLPQLLFSTFSGSGLSVGSDRYFQYRTIFESDDVSTTPDLKSVTVGPSR